MIVRERPSGLRLFLLLRGSVLPRILPSLALNMFVAALVTVSHGDLFKLKITLTPIPFSLIGLALAIFLGFRNNAAYDRYWEGRKLWGEIVHRSRSLSRQCLTLIDGPDEEMDPRNMMDVRVRMIRRTIAFACALKHLLRGADPAGAVAELRPHLLLSEWKQCAQVENRPNFLLQSMGRDLRGCLQTGRIDPCLAGAIDDSLTAMAAAAASCERIKGTPIPFSYTLLLHRTAYLYCFLLPFGLVDSIGFMTPFVVGSSRTPSSGWMPLGTRLRSPSARSPTTCRWMRSAGRLKSTCWRRSASRRCPQPWHPSITVFHNPIGVEPCLNITETASAWILSWGGSRRRPRQRSGFATA